MQETVLSTEDENLMTRVEFWTRKDRHEVYKHFRDEAPLAFHPEVPSPSAPEGGPGYWVATRYEDVKSITQNFNVFSNVQGTQPEEWPEFRIRALGMLHMDAPEHRMWRSIVGPAFAPRFLDGMLDRIRVIASEVVDQLLAEPDVDVVKNLVNSYPVRVIAGMLGMPEEDHAQFVAWTYDAFGPDREKGAIAHKALIDYGTNMAAERRANPKDDVMGRIVTAEVDGRALTDLESEALYRS